LNDKHLKKYTTEKKSDDPLNAFRSIHFKKDVRTNSEKVQESVAEAGQETRSVNQVVKLVNIHLNEKVKKLERLKEESKRFDEELNMFTKGIGEQQSVPSVPPTGSQASGNPGISDADMYAVTNDLILIINKYGFEKLSVALDRIISQNPQLGK
jgi:hypothetical protein